jgi:hypothetical protein
VTDSLMWVQNPTTPAVVTANVKNGCITGFNLINGGSGYRSMWNGVGTPHEAGLWITGGGGSGAVSQAAMVVNGSITGFDMAGVNCVGQGYTSAPAVQVVNWRGWLRFEGQNKSNTIIRLKDRTPGFTNGNCSVSTTEDLPRENCKAVIYTSSDGIANATGAGLAAYEDDIWNLTVDTGNGNAGAIAISWTGSNRASIRNVNIVSEDKSGRCGLDVSRTDSGGGGGPGYVKNVSINGFDYGINANANANQVGYTFEYINLANQNATGVLNVNMPNWFREVSSNNTVPVFVNQGTGNLLVVDGNFSGGSASVSAIENQANRNGIMFVRNITTSGYGAALATGSGNTPVSGATVSEYAYPSPVALFPSAMTSLNMQNIPNTPEWMDNNFNDWANVASFSTASQPNSWQDATAGIQAAMNSGKPVIYFPHGQYITTATIHIPSTVRKIIGANSLISGPNGQRQQFPVFSCESTSGNTVEIRNFTFAIDTIGNPTFLNKCSSDLVIADVFDANAYQNSGSGNGVLYLENAAIPGPSTFTNETVYARQFDVETTGNLHSRVNGGNVWVFGYKTEGLGGDPLWNVSNANFELLGGFSSSHSSSSGTAFTFMNSNFSLSAVWMYSGWSHIVSETRKGSTRVLSNPGGWVGTAAALYAGHN